VLLAHLPADSATFWAVDPKGAEAASWSRTDHLLAGVFDLLQTLLWQNANQGRKSPTPRPRPLPRPGVADDDTRRIGKPRPLDEVKAILASSRPGAGEAVSANGG
jgi:hypothetical protein